ncbi:hypothetical protein PM025_16635 [Halorubrum ezzemoulense]|uniref:transcription initiation factor IIB n=1 Tax=Halorubrum ezzemoulense TaxID=337243 RepID=UPI00232FF24A|nr:hypothetical protein [Halorubrum ezzemoulense]MDB2265727.1 hypothetical protein [Halorubrum ezzemoulense]
MTDNDYSEKAKVRMLKRAMEESNRLTEELELPREVREMSTLLYRQLKEKGEMPGRGIEEVVAAGTHIGCKVENVPCSAEEIAEHSDYGEKEILRTSKYLRETLGLDIGPTDPSIFLNDFCDDLDVDNEVRSKAEEILEASKQKGIIGGKSPSAVAAASIYSAGMFTNRKLTQKEIAEVANVTTVTIRHRYQEQIEAYSR